MADIDSIQLYVVEMKPMGGDRRGRGAEAVKDMQARIAAGWTVEELYDRNAAATASGSNGHTYDYVDYPRDGSAGGNR